MAGGCRSGAPGALRARQEALAARAPGRPVDGTNEDPGDFGQQLLVILIETVGHRAVQIEHAHYDALDFQRNHDFGARFDIAGDVTRKIVNIGNPLHHEANELFAAVVVNIIATLLKFGDRTQLGAVHLATSLVAVLQLLAATVLWFFAVRAGDGTVSSSYMASIVSLAAGAVFANVVSVIMLVAETLMLRR